MKYAILFVFLAGAFGMAGCGDSDEGVEKLPPAKIKPDPNKPANTDNPGGTAPATPL
jgi:hypothetical protein